MINLFGKKEKPVRSQIPLGEFREHSLEMVRCPECGKSLLREVVRRIGSVCPFCSGYFRMTARDRIRQLIDEDTFLELDEETAARDPLDFPGYRDRLVRHREQSGLPEAIVTGVGDIGGCRTALGVMDSHFMMGSMGSATGERIVRLFDYACEQRLPAIMVCASGGARMQEGMFALSQMARTSVAVSRHSRQGLLYISVLTHPTTGGVTASFAMQGDIILAEPGALVGFAGKRVIEQTVREELPENFQKSEFQYDNGFVDAIVPRESLKGMLARLLRLHDPSCAVRE
jgi:acetyl-CoA carboxylase carboxyl transferase beta subunit